MTLYVADFEANDLRPNADTIWCGILKPFQRSQVMRYYGKDTEPEIPYSGGCVYNFDYGLEVLKEDIHKNCTLIMHNGVQYDKWLLEHTLDITIPVWRIIDTLILSKLLWPNLKVPEGWKGKPRPHFEDFEESRNNDILKGKQKLTLFFLI